MHYGTIKLKTANIVEIKVHCFTGNVLDKKVTDAKTSPISIRNTAVFFDLNEIESNIKNYQIRKVTNFPVFMCFRNENLTIAIVMEVRETFASETFFANLDETA